jgi:lysophospholipase L1-like esterase
LLNIFPHLRIYLCTPTYRFWIADGVFAYDSDTYTHATSGLKLIDYANSMIEIGKEYHLPVIDNYNELGINKFSRVTYFAANDGTHHNAKGRELIAQHVAHKLF